MPVLKRLNPITSLAPVHKWMIFSGVATRAVVWWGAPAHFHVVVAAQREGTV